MQFGKVRCKVRDEHVKRKAEKINLNKTHNKKTPQGANASIELQVNNTKKYSKMN